MSFQIVESQCSFSNVSSFPFIIRKTLRPSAFIRECYMSQHSGLFTSHTKLRTFEAKSNSLLLLFLKFIYTHIQIVERVPLCSYFFLEDNRIYFKIILFSFPLIVTQSPCSYLSVSFIIIIMRMAHVKIMNNFIIVFIQKNLLL